MWDKLIDNIDEDTEFSDDLFFEILETADVLEKAQLLERIRKKCKKVDRLEEFERLLNALELKCALVNKECGTQPALKFNKSINITNVEEERREACCIHNSKGEVIGVKDCMVEELEEATFDEPAVATIKVELVDKVWTPSQEDLIDLEYALIDFESLYHME